MNSHPPIVALFAVAALLVAGCGNKAGKDQLPKGQVVASVDGEDITVHELNAELSGMPAANAAQQDALRRAVVQRLVERRALADYARQKALDELPDFTLQQHRAEEMILVGLLQRQLAGRIAPASRDDADRFIAAHPALFAQRRIYDLDQLAFDRPRDVGLLKAMQPMSALGDIERLLDANGIAHRRLGGQIDVLKADPRLVAAVSRLPAGDVFALPVGGQIVAAQVIGVRTVPFTGEDAIRYARNAVQRQRMRQATEGELEPVLRKSRQTVKYQPGFEPRPRTRTKA